MTDTSLRVWMDCGATLRSSRSPNFGAPPTGWLSNCYRVGGPNTASTSHNDNLESDEDVNIPDDCPALHCPDVPPATAEPPPTPCPHDGDVCGEPLCAEPLLAAPQPAVEEYLDPASVPRTWLRVLLARSLDRQASASCSFAFGGLYSV